MRTDTFPTRMPGATLSLASLRAVQAFGEAFTEDSVLMNKFCEGCCFDHVHPADMTNDAEDDCPCERNPDDMCCARYERFADLIQVLEDALLDVQECV